MTYPSVTQKTYYLLVSDLGLPSLFTKCYCCPVCFGSLNIKNSFIALVYYYPPYLSNCL